MNTFLRLCFALFTGALLLAGCAHQHPVQKNVPAARPEGARLSTDEVVRIAQQTAERKGIRLQDYTAPEAHYEFTQKNRSWSVFFEGRVRLPGNHFLVSVDDRTGAAELYRGK